MPRKVAKNRHFQVSDARRQEVQELSKVTPTDKVESGAAESWLATQGRHLSPTKAGPSAPEAPESGLDVPPGPDMPPGGTPPPGPDVPPGGKPPPRLDMPPGLDVLKEAAAKAQAAYTKALARQDTDGTLTSCSEQLTADALRTIAAAGREAERPFVFFSLFFFSVSWSAPTADAGGAVSMRRYQQAITI